MDDPNGFPEATQEGIDVYLEEAMRKHKEEARLLEQDAFLRDEKISQQNAKKIENLIRDITKSRDVATPIYDSKYEEASKSKAVLLAKLFLKWIAVESDLSAASWVPTNPATPISKDDLPKYKEVRGSSAQGWWQGRDNNTLLECAKTLFKPRDEDDFEDRVMKEISKDGTTTQTITGLRTLYTDLLSPNFEPPYKSKKLVKYVLALGCFNLHIAAKLPLWITAQMDCGMIKTIEAITNKLRDKDLEGLARDGKNKRQQGMDSNTDERRKAVRKILKGGKVPQKRLSRHAIANKIVELAKEEGPEKVPGLFRSRKNKFEPYSDKTIAQDIAFLRDNDLI